MRNHLSAAGLLGLAALCSPATAQATNVTFSGTVANLCVLNLATPGLLGLTANGTGLSSEETGGANASLTVVASGSNPTLSFAAPTMTGPSASTSGATSQIGYTSGGGANQAYTSGSSTYAMTRLTDTFVVKGKASNGAGFVSGLYGIATTVTCSQ